MVICHSSNKKKLIQTVTGYNPSDKLGNSDLIQIYSYKYTWIINRYRKFDGD